MKNIKKYCLLALLITLVWGAFYFLLPIPIVNAETTITVNFTRDYEPSYQWCQHSDLHWSTWSTIDGTVTRRNDSGQPSVNPDPSPNPTYAGEMQRPKIRTAANISVPPTAIWIDMNGNEYTTSKLTSTPIPISGIVSDDEIMTTTEGDITISNGQVIIEAKSGKGMPGGLPATVCGASPGYEYTFPITVTWQATITTNDGVAIIKHFTDTGQSLSAIFPDRQESLVKDQTYPYIHPTNSNYDYLGYIKTTTGATPSYSQGTSLGNPPSFIYDNSFPTYTLYYYYKLKSGGTPAPEPEPEPEEPDIDPNLPPVAIIYSLSEVRRGEKFTANGWGSYDSDGTIVDYYWNAPGSEGTLTGESGIIWYMGELGEKQISLAVEDNDGVFSGTSKTINVIEPFVYAQIDVGGALKENRKVIINAGGSNSPHLYPIIWGASYIEINPLDGQPTASIKYSGGLAGAQSKEVLFKQTGRYEAKVFVKNQAGYSDTASFTFYIAPDTPPVTNFNLPIKTFRDPLNNNQASVTLTDMSESLDGDIISQRIWKYRYDSDNDGNYAEEAWVVLDGTNKTSLLFKSNSVGRYEFFLEVFEQFGQPTMLEYIIPSDYRFGDTRNKALVEKVLLIDNRAPSVQWGP